MPLILLSGRPGVGKTAFGRWLSEQRGFVHVDTDAEWPTWGQLMCVQSPAEAAATRARASALGGAGVIVEWGFRPSLLPSVRLLRGAGFDAWWFDADETTARKGYVDRHGDSREAMTAFQVQMTAIDSAWPELELFYGNHVVVAVDDHSVHVPFATIAARLFYDAS